VATQPQALTHIVTDPAQGRLRIRGELSGAAGAELYNAVQQVVATRPAAVCIELAAVPRMDSLGGAWLGRVAEILRQAGVTLHIEGARGQVQDFLQLIGPTLYTPPPPRARQPGFFETLGDTVLTSVAEAQEALALVVDTVYWTFLAPFTRHGLRWGSLVDELGRMGVHATFIVLLMNFLLGVVIALLSAAQLRQFGAEIFVADLVAISFTRELAAMMTAIIVAARSGSAITAELATMAVQEEIDALKGMGFQIAPFLVAPKLWAMLVAMPMLTVLGMFTGVFGGLQIGVFHLDIDPQTWMHETLAAISVRDVLQGLSKSLVFGATIVFVGCHNGLRVRGGAQGVGSATTRAVVMDVVLIIIWDMLFALLFEFVV
jgi:phospholipid/cholesterol/gamma-HCH transport system permease protein